MNQKERNVWTMERNATWMRIRIDCLILHIQKRIFTHLSIPPSPKPTISSYLPLPLSLPLPFPLPTPNAPLSSSSSSSESPVRKLEANLFRLGGPMEGRAKGEERDGLDDDADDGRGGRMVNEIEGT